ncbi:hypothetical protein Clacol_010183 [Clathrus columnatus]|uniref:Fungal-type protein kinase domain-containing protein n=1 Tax=Clathrus columnatus TaxID=1419009 RepID=A0AAV5AT38_9AGAM|nr:hypothetical protein Clacol_010183 [Clathrus columnatus]
MSRQVTPPQSQNRSVATGSTDTPMSRKQSGFEPYSSTPPSNRNQRFQNMASEISKYVVGPMPVSEFLNRFLRPKTAPKEQKSGVPSATTTGLQAYLAGNYVNQYQSLVNALQPICPNFEIRDTNTKPVTTFQGYTIRPDVCVFNRGSNDVDITQAEIMMELKSDKNDDPFADESKMSFVKGSTAGKNTLGQTTVYAAAHQASQFRTHAFSVLMFLTYARLLRWDRSGVVATGAIPIDSPEFIEFFQLFDQATPQMRGIDTSVSTPSPENASEARISLGIGSNIPLVQFSLDFLSDKAYNATNGVYIASRDAYMNKSHSPLGRSTRTFIAYSTSHQCNIFLKDSWRLDSQTPEHKIYNTLHAQNVPCLPTVLAGSDIFDQTTITQDVLSENPIWMKVQPKPLRKHRHHRLILKEIATPLHLFSSTKILVSAIYDAIKAHSAAFKAGILHRDISSGNIMIYNNGGLLIDWDLSKNTEDKNARESERTGTWQFISCRLLKDPTAAQGLTDDVESFIHVLTWVSFRYAKHNLGGGALESFLGSVFDHAYYEEDGLVRGGDNKMNYLTSPSQLMETEFGNLLLKGLLLNITDTIATRYRRPPTLRDADDDEATLDRLLNARQKRLKKLEDSEWIINEFASVLKLPDWPANDEARKHEITHTSRLTTHIEGSLKRKSSEDAGRKGKKTRALASK